MTETAVQTLASEWDIAVEDLEIVLRAVTRGTKSKATWIRLCRIAERGHSHTITLHFNRGYISSTEATVTSLEALDRTISDGRA